MNLLGAYVLNTAELIYTTRQRLGLTQQGLADLAGVSRHTIIDVESGKSSPSVSTLEKVLDALGLRIEVVPNYRKSPVSTPDAYREAYQLSRQRREVARSGGALYEKGS